MLNIPVHAHQADMGAPQEKIDELEGMVENAISDKETKVPLGSVYAHVHWTHPPHLYLSTGDSSLFCVSTFAEV